MNVTAPGLEFYIDQLCNGQPFAFVRYGNGEWDCILNLFYRTGSGSQRFTPDLRNALTASLTTGHIGAYYIALQSTQYLTRLGLLPKAEAWLSDNAPDLEWHDGEVFTKASMKGQLYPLIAAFSMRRSMVVGPKWLKDLPFANLFIPVNSHNCWEQVDAIEQQLQPLREVAILFSAGPTAKVLIHRLQPVIGEHSWLIDCGSLWDPYCGVRSRRYHHLLTPAIIGQNLTGQ